MVWRLLAFALFRRPGARLRGYASMTSPTCGRRDLTGAIRRWIDVGQPG